MPQVSANLISDSDLRLLEPRQLEALDPQDILSWALKNYRRRIALSCSFGAPEGLVLLDMMHRIDPHSRVFVIDTGRLPQATYSLIDRIRERYDKEVEVIFPRTADVETLVREKGMNSFYDSVESRQLCCGIRKVEPLRRYLADMDAWVTGLRRDQNPTRATTPKLELDHLHGGIVKVNPIAGWTREQVLDYVEAHGVPTNRLHAEGYPSVGCAPCTRPIKAGEDPRAGRWWWEQGGDRECGIHTSEEEQGSGI